MSRNVGLSAGLGIRDENLYLLRAAAVGTRVLNGQVLFSGTWVSSWVSSCPSTKLTGLTRLLEVLL